MQSYIASVRIASYIATYILYIIQVTPKLKEPMHVIHTYIHISYLIKLPID